MNCFECGDIATENHHIIPKILGGIKTIPLCSKCHSKVHNLGERRDNISTLTKIGLEKKKIKNERIGQIPFGYKLHKNNINIIEDEYEQSIINKVLELKRKGLSYSKISEQLKIHGYKNKSGNIKWNKTQIFRILKNNNFKKL